MRGSGQSVRGVTAAVRGCAGLVGVAILLGAGLTAGCEDQPEMRPVDYAFDIAVGYVWDEFVGEPLEGVEVWNGSVLSAHSDSTGHYAAPAGFHPVENWRITFVMAGYKSRAFDMPEAAGPDPEGPYTYRLDVVLTRSASTQRPLSTVPDRARAR